MSKSQIDIATLRFTLDGILAALTLDPTRDADDLKNEREAAAAMLAALHPLDAIQAAIAARAIVAHHTSMECFRRAALDDVPNALMTRLFASGMALSRMSMQLIKVLEQRKGMMRPGASVDPLAAILAGVAAEAPHAAPSAAAGTQHPMPSEKRPAAAAPKGAAAQKPAPAASAAARAAQATTSWSGRPVMTREEIAAMAGLPVSMIPAA